MAEILATHLPNDRYEIHLGLITQTLKDVTPELLATTAVHCLGASRIRGSVGSLLCLIRQVRPDVLLSSMAHLNFVVLMLRPFFPRRVRVIVRQNGTVSSMLASSGSPKLQRLMYRQLYVHADRIICQSRAMAEDLQKISDFGKNHLAVLHNPVDVVAIRAALARIPIREEGRTLQLLAVGRLSPEKGFDLLLHALAAVRRDFSDVVLTIAGNGSQMEELQRLCRNLGIQDAVQFCGHVDNLTPLFAASTLFVLPSRHEGMPNAMFEAAAAGLPLVATPASQGVVDLLRNQPGSWLADAVSSEAIGTALHAAIAAIRPGQRTEHRWIRPFSLAEAIPAYCGLIDDVLVSPRR